MQAVWWKCNAWVAGFSVSSEPFASGCLAGVEKFGRRSGIFSTSFCRRFLPVSLLFFSARRFSRRSVGLSELLLFLLSDVSNKDMISRRKKYSWYPALVYCPRGSSSFWEAPWPVWKNVESGLVALDQSAGSCLFLVSNLFFDSSRAFWKSVSPSSCM